jgi:hypothetical protein
LNRPIELKMIVSSGVVKQRDGLDRAADDQREVQPERGDQHAADPPAPRRAARGTAPAGRLASAVTASAPRSPTKWR